MVFPDVRGQRYTTFVRVFKTQTTPLSDAGDQRYPVDGSTKTMAVFNLGWESLSDTEASSIYEAFNNLAGSWGAMYWYEWDFRIQTSYAIATGDGVEDTFTIPAKGTTFQTFYKAGVPVAATVNVGAGTNGEDTFTFTVAPGVDVAVTANFTGRMIQQIHSNTPTPALVADPTGTNRWSATATLVAENPN